MDVYHLDLRHCVSCSMGLRRGAQRMETKGDCRGSVDPDRGGGQGWPVDWHLGWGLGSV